ncbi:MAG: hypothetical protein HFG49_03565 [Lachnospiraceae bacterium]|jgi:hypothetical protein|nr:hypothetical protein [Lachnospiraceae bacterium]
MVRFLVSGIHSDCCMDSGVDMGRRRAFHEGNGIFSVTVPIVMNHPADWSRADIVMGAKHSPIAAGDSKWAYGVAFTGCL